MPKWLSKRRFLQLAAGAALSSAGLGLYAWRFEPIWMDVVQRLLPIAQLPAGWHHRRIVQLSDLHVGTLVDSDYLIAALQRIDELDPDLVVITGDFMSCQSSEQIDEVLRVIGHLKHPRQGILATLGNHDYGRRWSRPDVAAELSARLESTGITVLRNAAREIDGLTVIGVDDLWGGLLDLGAVRTELAGEGAKLVLCHNPDVVDHLGWSGYQGWILSGHTHGGQCKPPFLPPPILPVENRRYTAGAFDLWDGRWLYINKGLGWLKRVRFNVRPEITVFELTPA